MHHTTDQFAIVPHFAGFCEADPLDPKSQAQEA